MKSIYYNNDVDDEIRPMGELWSGRATCSHMTVCARVCNKVSDLLRMLLLSGADLAMFSDARVQQQAK